MSFRGSSVVRWIIVTLFIFSVFAMGVVPVFAEAEKEVHFVYIEDCSPYQIIEDDLSGYEVDLLNAIFEGSDYKIHYIFADDVPEEAMFSSLIYFSGKKTEDENYKKSDLVYYRAYSALSFLGGYEGEVSISELRNLRVGVLAKQYSDVFLTENGIDTIHYYSTGELLDALQKGEIDVAYTAVESAMRTAADMDILSKLVYHSELTSNEPVYLWMPEDNKELIELVNTRLEELYRNGENERLYQSYFMCQSTRAQLEYTKTRALAVSFSLSIALLIIGIVIAIALYSSYQKHKLSSSLIEGILNYGKRFVLVWKTDYSYYEMNDYFKRTFYDNSDGGKLADFFRENAESQGQNSEIADKMSANVMENEVYINSIRDKIGALWEISWTSVVINERNGVKTVLSIGSDVTEKNRLRRELKESDARSEIILENTGVAYMNVENDGALSYLSNYAYSLIGVRRPDINEFVERIHPSDRRGFFDAVEEARNTDVMIRREIRIISDDDSIRWFVFKFRKLINNISKTQSVAGLFFDNTAEREKDLKIEKLAFRDDLTGIYNRRKFLSIVKDTIRLTKRDRFAIITFNLDKFHRFNDLYGVEVGDNILQLIAKTLLANPYSTGCYCARLGSDEFASFIPLGDNQEDDELEEYVLELSEKFRDLVATECDDIKFTISAGACVYPDNAANYRELYERAIYSMRIAKSNPNIIFRLHDDEIMEQILNRETLEKKIYEAVRNQEFEIYYQPKVSADDMMIKSAEALIRWNSPDRGIVSPGEFIPVAEEIGVISEIGNWMLLNACRQNKKWQDEGLTPIKISVNISAIEFYQTDIVANVAKILETTGVAPEYLEIELTESMALVDVDATIIKMTALRELGVGISMDDFGTGYSSLSYIQNLPIDELKLDKSFVDKISKDETTKNITSAMVNLAKTIGLTVVAEGVEEWEQFDLLKEMQCDLIQGYLFSKPVKAEVFEEYLRSGTFKSK